MFGVRPLVLLGFISAFLLMVYYTFSPSSGYPVQDVTKDEVIQVVHTFASEYELDSHITETDPLVETQANESIGRYVQMEGWTTEEIEVASRKIPFYDIVLVYDRTFFYIDPLHNQVLGVDGIEVGLDDQTIDEWVLQLYGPTFKKEKEIEGDFGSVVHMYSSGKVMGEIEEKVRVNVSYDDTITGIKRFGLVEGLPLKEGFNVGEGLSFLVFFLTLLIVSIAVTIQIIRKFYKNRVEVVVWPILISLFAGFGWVYTSYIAMGRLEVFSMVFAVVITYVTCLILILTGRKEDYDAPLHKKVASFKPAILNGFLLMIISTLLVEIFYFVAMKFGAWSSPVMDYAIFLNAPLMALPFFALFMGISAAISEEAIFRRYLIPIFDRFGVWISLLFTSYLWAIGHVGYHMYPWHIRIIEFMIIVGPLFYFIYKRYGFLTAIFCHFFYNSFFGALFLLGLDVRIGLLTLLLTLSPFFIFLVKNKTEEERAFN